MLNQIHMHLESLRAAGVLFLPNVVPNMPMPPTQQFRRCAQCQHCVIAPFTPSTALPCPKCRADMLVSAVTIDDLANERRRCADALGRLAAQCEQNAGSDGKVTATGAANHMRELAKWMLEAQ